MLKVSYIFFLTVVVNTVKDIHSTYSSSSICTCPITAATLLLLMSWHFLSTSMPATFQSSALHHWQIKNPSVISRCLTTPKRNPYSCIYISEEVDVTQCRWLPNKKRSINRGAGLHNREPGERWYHGIELLYKCKCSLGGVLWTNLVFKVFSKLMNELGDAAYVNTQ